jgi:hypothetical protein
MEELKDLTYIINRYSVRNIDVITNPEKKKTKDELRFWEFYVGIDKDTWKTDDEAAQHFGYQSKSDKGFRRLKENLKERLLTTILFLEGDQVSSSEKIQKIQKLNKLFAISEVLKHKGAMSIYLDVANEALDLAIEVENLFFIVYITNILRGYYCQKHSEKKEFEKLNNIFEKYWPAFYTQTEVQHDYLLLAANFINQKGYKVSLSEKVKNVYEKHKDHIENYDHLMINVYARTIEIYSKTVEHDWEGGIIASDSALMYLDKKSPNSIEYRTYFGNHKASCLLMLGKYSDALLSLDDLMAYVPDGFSSWFKNREIAAVTNLYAENYQASWELVQMALNHERFKIISEVDQETWRLYFGYLHFIGKVENKSYWENDDQPASRFRLSRLMNEMPNYTQDKRGGNIPLLILQVLFLLSDMKENKENFDIICNKVDAIKKYSSRNLDDKSEHFRSDCFIHLLGLLPKHFHDPKTLIKTAHPVLHRMSTVQIEVIDNSFEVEVVPYERQWAWIIYYIEQAAS